MSSFSKIFGSAALFGLMQLQSGIGSLAPEVSGLKMNPLTKIPTKVEDFDIQYSKASRQLCLNSLKSTSEEVRLKALQKLDEVLNEEYLQITQPEAKLKIDAILKLLAGEKIWGIRDAAFKTLLNLRFIKLGVPFDEYIDKIVDVINLYDGDISPDIYTETNAQKLLNLHAGTFVHGYQKLLHKVKEPDAAVNVDATKATATTSKDGAALTQEVAALKEQNVQLMAKIEDLLKRERL